MCNVGNGVVDHLPRPGLKQSLVGPELACGISERNAKWLANDCWNRTIKTLKSPYLNQNIRKFSVKRTRELSGLNRYQLRHMTGLTTNRTLSLERSPVQIWNEKRSHL